MNAKTIKIISITFALLVLIGFFYLKFTHFFEINSCIDKGGSWNYEKKTCEIDSRNFRIDTFSTFPQEIDGCSCLFSNDSSEYNKGKFICINDFAQIAFLKINGVLVKFIQKEFKTIDSHNIIATYKSENYEMRIESKSSIANGINTGTIKITNKKGKTITKFFYGECGC